MLPTRLALAVRQERDTKASYTELLDNTHYFSKGFSRTVTTAPYGLSPEGVEQRDLFLFALRSHNVDALENLQLATPPASSTYSQPIRLVDPEAALRAPMVGSSYNRWFQRHGLVRARPQDEYFPMVSMERTYAMTELYLLSGLRDIPISGFFPALPTTPLPAEVQHVLALVRAESSTAYRTFLHLDPNGLNVQPWHLLEEPTFVRVRTGASSIPSPAGFLSSLLPKIPQGWRNTGSPNYLTTITDAVNAQQGTLGAPVFSSSPPEPTERNIITLRDLAWITESPNSIWNAFFHAVQILQYSPTNESLYISRVSVPWITRGATLDLIAVLGDVLRIASEGAFSLKWRQFLSARPEEWGILAYSEFIGSSATSNNVFGTEILTNPLLRQAMRFANPTPPSPAPINAVLPQVFPNGAPVSPSYPSVHAVQIGALVTVLKSFYREVATFGTMTIHTELDRLAWNLAFGRCVAGVSTRADVLWGMRIGESIATEYLREYLTRMWKPSDVVVRGSASGGSSTSSSVYRRPTLSVVPFQSESSIIIQSLNLNVSSLHPLGSRSRFLVFIVVICVGFIVLVGFIRRKQGGVV